MVMVMVICGRVRRRIYHPMNPRALLTLSAMQTVDRACIAPVLLAQEYRIWDRDMLYTIYCLYASPPISE